ncbi:MAG: hypothetical protein IPM83_16785 [Ignavibacteria bacterium]|nr:hypothetical protein [Ignavibacteria bacterium]
MDRSLFSSTNEMVFKLIWWAVIMVLLFVVIRSMDDHQRTLFLVAISCPVILLHGIMDMHLDMIMALLTVLSIILNSKGRPSLHQGSWDSRSPSSFFLFLHCPFCSALDHGINV